MAIAAETEIGDAVVAALLETERRRPLDHPVIVVDDLAAFTIDVVDDRRLRGESHDRPVLQIGVGDEQVIVAERSEATLHEIVESRRRVFLDPAQPGEVVLQAIVGAGAEQAYSQRRILKQEAAEVGREGLHTDPQ